MKLEVGVNDLATTHSNLCKEWDYEKNHTIAPHSVIAGGILLKKGEILVGEHRIMIA